MEDWENIMYTALIMATVILACGLLDHTVLAAARAAGEAWVWSEYLGDSTRYMLRSVLAHEMSGRPTAANPHPAVGIDVGRHGR
jgi:hypothetical protein